MKKKRGNGDRVREMIEADRQRAQVLIRFAAGPPIAGESVKARMSRTAKILGWSFTRVDDIWRGKARRVDAYEMDQLRAVVGSLRNKVVS